MLRSGAPDDDVMIKALDLRKETKQKLRFIMPRCSVSPLTIWVVTKYYTLGYQCLHHHAKWMIDYKFSAQFLQWLC